MSKGRNGEIPRGLEVGFKTEVNDLPRMEQGGGRGGVTLFQTGRKKRWCGKPVCNYICTLSNKIVHVVGIRITKLNFNM